MKKTVFKNTYDESLAWCDRGIVISTCLTLFFLPISIALIESFSGFILLFFVIKKVIQSKRRISSLAHDRLTWWELFFKDFHQNLILPQHPLRWSLLMFLGAVFLSVLFSQDRVSSIVAFIGKFIQGIFIMLSIQEGFKRRQDVSLFAWTFLFSGILVSASALVQFATGHDFLRGNPINSDGRVSSCMRHANDLGIYLVMVMGVIMGFLGHPKLRLLYRIVTFLALVYLFNLHLLILSRSAFVGLIALVLFVLCFNRKFLWVAAVIIFSAIFIFGPTLKDKRHVYLLRDNNQFFDQFHKPLLQQTLNNYTPDNESSLASVSSEAQVDLNKTFIGKIILQVSRLGGSGRAEYWDKALRVIQTAPVLGTGLNTYSKQVEKLPGLWGGGYAHNCYLQMTAETGLVGLLTFLLFFFLVFFYGIKALKDRHESVRLMLVVAMGLLFAYLVQSFFDTTFYSVQLGNLLWILCGVVIALSQKEVKAKSSSL